MDFVFPGYASVTGGNIRKTNFESRLRQSKEWGSAWGNPGVFVGDESPCVTKKCLKLDCDAQSCSCAGIPCAHSPFSREYIEVCGIYWLKGVGTSLYRKGLTWGADIFTARCGSASGVWYVSPGNHRECVNNCSSWCKARFVCYSDSWERRGG